MFGIVLNRPFSTKAETGGACALTELRVLFIPKNSRTGYFRSFLEEGRQMHNWRIDVVTPPRDARAWHGIADQFTEIPDFTKVQAWESDQAACDRLDDFISSCERHSAVSAGRLLLGGERDLGRGFSWANFYWFHDETARQAMADNTAPMRILRRIFAFARESLEAANPDLVLAGEWAHPLCFAFSLAARQMGIPCVTNRLSKIWSGRCYWSTGPQMYNELARAHADELRGQNAAVAERSRTRLAEFRSAPATLGYVKQNWLALDRRGWFGEHVALLRLLGRRILYRLRSESGPPPKPALRLLGDLYRRTYLSARQARLFRRFSEDELCRQRYVLFAMHKDPEQALNYQAPFWSNQYNTVSLISSALPDGHRLLVREHRNNRGRRPTQYYKDLRRLPGVVMIDGLDDQFKYLRNAALIVTENGSSGWEGLILNRRVVCLDETFYTAAGLTRPIANPEHLARMVLETIEQPAVRDAAAHDRGLGWMMDAEWATTAPVDDPGYVETLALLERCVSAAMKSASKTVRVSA
jgi:hypothetical protein